MLDLQRGSIVLSSTHSLPAVILDLKTYKQVLVQLSTGDRLIVNTDTLIGFTQQNLIELLASKKYQKSLLNSNKDLFKSLENIKSVIEEIDNKSPQEINEIVSEHSSIVEKINKEVERNNKAKMSDFERFKVVLVEKAEKQALKNILEAKK